MTTPSELQEQLQPLVDSAANAHGRAKQAAEILENRRVLAVRMPNEEMMQPQPQQLLLAKELLRKSRRDIKQTLKGLDDLIDSLL